MAQKYEAIVMTELFTGNNIGEAEMASLSEASKTMTIKFND